MSRHREKPHRVGLECTLDTRGRVRRGRTPTLCFLAFLVLAATPGTVRPAPVLPTGFVDQTVVADLTNLVGMAFLPDGRLFVVERHGRIRMVVDGKLGAIDPIAVVDSLFWGSLEAGLLGIAVDPQWPDRPYVYVYYDGTDSTIHISRFRAVGDLDSSTSVNLSIDTSSRYELFRDIPDKNEARNGGTLRFGPDGMLYTALADDMDECAAQDTTGLRGVLLRLKVDGLPDGPGGPPDKSLLAPPDNPFTGHPDPDARLVWALGLRNPFRFHIDPATGAVFIADVGESQYEEINLADVPGLNFGWPHYEGPAARTVSCGPSSIPLTTPIFAYDRTGIQSSAVISGGVYRSVACSNCNFPPEYEGDYFFSDWYTGLLRRLKSVDGAWDLAAPVPGQPSPSDWGRGFEEATDFLVGPDGALWYCKLGSGGSRQGEVHRIVYSPTPTAVGARPAEDGVVFAAPYPSPARGRATFSYTLPRRARVDLTLHDATGRRVARIGLPATEYPGRHQRTWDGLSDGGQEVAPGIYVARLVVDGVPHGRRVPVLR